MQRLGVSLKQSVSKEVDGGVGAFCISGNL